MFTCKCFSSERSTGLDSIEIKSLCAAAAAAGEERGVRILERNSSADSKVSEGRGRGGDPGAGAETAQQPVVKTTEGSVMPLQPVEVQGEQKSTPSLWRTPHQNKQMLREDCDPVGSLCWSSLLA